MICPVCEGICGKVKHYVDKYSSFMYMESCQHCDGQGEINHGQYWLCEYADPCDGLGVLLYCDFPDFPYPGWFFRARDQMFRKCKDVKPIVRVRVLER